ncbi:hypothetical protein GCM10022235_00440 [Kribbella ginsengisoli]|uniref:Uncharacterized protein n=1 Tax=Kribbella ginsengisoli TaxID=363865 RepID=A0ABP6VKX1_9ACTN
MESDENLRRQAKRAVVGSPVDVRVPERLPVVYPQAARALCRIVVRLARMERSAENSYGLRRISERRSAEDDAG